MLRPRWGVGRCLRHALALAGLTLVAVAALAVALSAVRFTASASAAERAEAPARQAAAAARPDVSTGPETLAVAALVPVSRAEPAPAPPPTIVIEGELRPGDSLARALRRDGVPQPLVNVITANLRSHFDFRRSQPGHRYRLSRDEHGRLVDFRYRISEFDILHLFPDPDGKGFAVQREEEQLTPRTARIAGVVTSSLYRSIRDLGESGQLAADFSEIFAWDVDFSRSVQPGDEFRILYERLYRVDEGGEETYVRPGRILAARYEGAVGTHAAVYFEVREGVGGYYRPDGSSVQRQFLMAPLRYSRVSSRFTGARRHPILKVTRPHQGIDYAAPSGTPVWAVSDGEVIYRGWAGGFGNLVKVRHSNGYVSYYAHLSRFARGLRVGQTLRQKQVLGYVGQTGLATGPHVCFRIAQNGHYVDPARLRTPAGPPIAPEIQSYFLGSRDVLLAELDAGLVVATDEAL